MIKSLGSLFVALLVLCAVLHGYLQVEYKTVVACDAALLRVKSDFAKQGLLGKGQSLLMKFNEGLVGTKSLSKDLEKDVGLVGCYKIALLGMNKKELWVGKKRR